MNARSLRDVRVTGAIPGERWAKQCSTTHVARSNQSLRCAPKLCKASLNDSRGH